MRKADLIAKFGTQTAAARAIGVTQGRISQWGEVVPELRARQIYDRWPDIALRLEDYAPARRKA